MTILSDIEKKLRGLISQGSNFVQQNPTPMGFVQQQIQQLKQPVQQFVQQTPQRIQQSANQYLPQANQFIQRGITNLYQPPPKIVQPFVPLTEMGRNVAKGILSDTAERAIIGTPEQLKTSALSKKVIGGTATLQEKKEWQIGMSKEMQMIAANIALSGSGKLKAKPLSVGGEIGGVKTPQPISQPVQSPIMPVQPEVMNDASLIKRMANALKVAKPIRESQEVMYSKARSQKLGEMMAAREKMAGEKGFYEELSTLKGELPKAEYEPIRQEFTQPNVDRLFNMVKETNSLTEWEKINAQVGLTKLLGEKGTGVPTRNELEKLHRIFGKDLTDSILAKRPTLQKMGELGLQLYNITRSTMAGVGDLSATLMQNLMFAYRHPIITGKNFVKELEIFKSEKSYNALMDQIRTRPSYQQGLYEKAKVNFTEMGSSLGGREEAFMSPIIEKVPGIGNIVRATGRAYSGFLNLMRADVFDNIYNANKDAELMSIMIGI